MITLHYGLRQIMGKKTAKTKFVHHKTMLDHVEPMWFVTGAIQRGNLRKRFDLFRACEAKAPKSPLEFVNEPQPEGNGPQPSYGLRATCQ